MSGLILVTGGTGTLGRVVVQRLVAQSRPVRVLSRRPPPAEPGPAEWATGDLKTGRGVGAAVAGADVIVHCATGLGDVGAAQHLIASARRAGSPHLTYISIVGVDRTPAGYYKSKLKVERLAELATGPAAGRVPDMGGPEVRGAASLALSYLAARGRDRPVVPVRLPGTVFAGYRRGDHLAPDHAVGRVTFEEFLAERWRTIQAVDR
jgi:nucleoside-diphosphate-sugar epimerase